MSVKRVGLFLSCVLAVLALAGSAVWASGGRGGGGAGGNQRQVRSRGGGGGGAQRGRGRGGSQTRGVGRGGGQVGRQGGSPHQYRRQYQHQYQPQYRHGQGQGPGLGQGRQHRWQYNHAEEHRFGGTVLEEPEQGRGRGTDKSILVRADDGATRRVQLGPPWFTDGLDLAPQPGDTVELIGAAHGESGAVQARELAWNGHLYRLRAEQGAPMWAGADREEWGRYAGSWRGGAPEEIIGEIEGIDGIAPGGPDMGRGVVLRLRTRDQERERVHLGPYWYVEDAMPGLSLGQRVTVQGVRGGPQADDALMAMQMERNQQRLRLRTREGRPEWAGGWQNWDGWGPGSRYSHRYRPETETGIEGVVEDVEEMTPMPGMGRGLALNVRTREGMRQRAHLGPVWFAEQSDIAPAPGEPISVTGSVVEMNGKPVLMVREMTRANQRVRLRERDGTPVWSGRALAEEATAAEDDTETG